MSSIHIQSPQEFNSNRMICLSTRHINGMNIDTRDIKTLDFLMQVKEVRMAIYSREQPILTKRFQLYLPILHYMCMWMCLMDIFSHGNSSAVLIIQTTSAYNSLSVDKDASFLKEMAIPVNK